MNVNIDFVVLIFVATTNLSSEKWFSGSVTSNTSCMLNLSSHIMSCITPIVNYIYGCNIIQIVLHFPTLVAEPRPLPAVYQETATDQESGKFTCIAAFIFYILYIIVIRFFFHSCVFI